MLSSSSGSACLAQDAAELRYSVVAGGRIIGAMDVGGDRSSAIVRFRYADRGRGPDLISIVWRHPDGRTRAIAARGTSYAQKPIDERFTEHGKLKRWRSRADRGAAPRSGHYFAFEATPEDYAALARAALARPDRKLALLPRGEARIVPICTVDALSATGARRSVELHFLHGLALSPVPIWLDDAKNLFLFGDAWTPRTVQAGFEAEDARFLALQDRQLAAWVRRATKASVRHTAVPLVIHRANMFDVFARSMRPGMTVILRGERIEQVGPDGTLDVPADAIRIDAAGRSLLPGLWDMHAHLVGSLDGPLILANGITSARDLGNNVATVTALRNAYDRGDIPGPRLLLAGLLDSPGRNAVPFGGQVATEAQVRDAIARYAELGYEQVKIYSALDPALVPAAIKYTRQHGLKASGHIPGGMVADDAIDAGFDEIQHILFLVLNFFPEDAQQTSSMDYQQLAGRRSAELDLQRPEVAAFISRLRAANVAIDPTMSIMELLYRGRPGLADPGLLPVAERLPPLAARRIFGGGLLGDGLAKSPQQRVLYRRSFERMRTLLARLHAAGVPLVTGSDSSSGFRLVRELELWAAAGIPPPDILRAATLDAASLSRRADNLGSISPGKLADLILVDGDPSRTIGDLRRIALVIKDGAVIDHRQLLTLANVTPASPEFSLPSALGDAPPKTAREIPAGSSCNTSTDGD